MKKGEGPAEAGIPPSGQEDEKIAATGKLGDGGFLSGADRNRIAQLVANSSDWLWETDASHRWTWVGDACMVQTGIKRSAIVGRSRVQALAVRAQEDPLAAAHLADLAAHRPFRSFIDDLKSSQPGCRFVELSGIPRFDAEGRFAGYQGTARNVTPLMERAAPQACGSEDSAVPQTVASQAEMRERMQAGLDALADGFVLWDKHDRLLVYNDAFRREYAVLEGSKLGRSFEELLAEYAHSDAVPSLRGREDEWMREQVEARGGELDQEILYQSSDGRWMLRRDRLTATGDRVGIRTDVTEMKRREDELAEANRRAEHLVADFEHTLNTLRMGVVLLDQELEAEIINQAFYDLWKLDRDAVKVGDHFRALMDVNRHNGIYDVTEARWEEYVGRRLAEIRAGDVEPREFHRADGSTLIYSVTSLSGGKRLVCYYDVTEMKQREAALNVAVERMGLADAVINAVKDPIFVKDQDLRFVFVNKAFAAMFDRMPGDMLGLPGGDFVTPAEAELFEASERRVLETGETFEVEEDFEFKGIGRSRIVRKNLVSTDSGNTYVSGFVFDVTEIRRREREAEQARNQLAHVLETLPAGVVIYDKDDRFVLSNRKIHESLPAIAHLMRPGCPLRPAIEEGRKAGYFGHTDDPELDALYDTDPQAWLEGYFNRYHVDHHVSERKNIDGRWFQVHDTRTKDGLFVGVRVDITELKEREVALKESMWENELFRSLIDSVPVAIYAKRPDLRIIYLNQGWSDLTGIPKESAIGHTDAEVFGADGEIFMEGDRRVLESGELLEIEEVATAADGSIRHQIARKGLMSASDGSLYLIGSSSDVTEMKRREGELRAAEQRAVLADRAKSEFLANMSHEIRTPMNGVLGMAELLAKTDLNQKQKTFTDIIVKSGNALLTIINDILDFSKIDAGQLVLDPAPFHLGESVEDVATLMATRAKEKDLELIVRVDPALPRTVVGDAGRLRQIVTNLVGNAVKFTDSGHVLVDVSGEVAGESVKLRFKVTDTGIGIPEDKLGHVFEKFSQVDASSTRRHEGTGLGLAITSRLVALMGGEIGVESEFGKGSTFSLDIILPLGDVETRRKVTPHDVTGARVLVVDDNAVNRAILMEQMTAWGFDACAAESGPEALAVLKETARLGVRVDCVVLDYQMPGVSGSDVAAAMRTLPAHANTPIIMLTSVDQSLSLAQNRDLGIGTQLIKPARSSALLEALVSHIQRHHDDIVVPAASAEPAPVEREAIGQPVAERAEPVETASPAAPPMPQSRRLDILVAEDNEVNQLVFAQILSDTPYSFEIVRNGRLAVEAHAEMRPGMILMDVSMPEMNGLEATSAIRVAEADAEHVPIVGVTAHALKGDRERCLAAGMDDYMSKPISPNMLLEKIQRWLDAPERALHKAG